MYTMQQQVKVPFARLGATGSRRERRALEIVVTEREPTRSALIDLLLAEEAAERRSHDAH